MKHTDRIAKLLDSLKVDVVSARAGSTQSQFPVLDILGGVRDEAAA